MVELHGVLSIDRIHSQDELKRYLVYFDKLRFATSRLFHPDDPMVAALEYLMTVGAVHSGPVDARDLEIPLWEIPISPSLREVIRDDLIVRYLVQKIGPQPDCTVVGIYEHNFWDDATKDLASSLRTALSVGFSCLPQPHELSAFEDILNFRQELREKQWGFRRFLKTLATKQLTEAEMRDEIEWL